jgi:hypothetical protein
LSNGIDEIREGKQQEKEYSDNGELGIFEQTFRFFHGFFLPMCFPEDQEKIEEDKGRKVDKGLKLIRKCKGKITNKKENSAQDNPENQ